MALNWKIDSARRFCSTAPDWQYHQPRCAARSTSLGFAMVARQASTSPAQPRDMEAIDRNDLQP
ncbi:hypothetical protein PHBOTO_000564 [Pseudozyma hubeiensis]|nr:hypothetical protein PHBOTO_000564 [Pseudozyma hubeiensis]